MECVAFTVSCSICTFGPTHPISANKHCHTPLLSGATAQNKFLQTWPCCKFQQASTVIHNYCLGWPVQNKFLQIWPWCKRTQDCSGTLICNTALLLPLMGFAFQPTFSFLLRLRHNWLCWGLTPPPSTFLSVCSFDMLERVLELLSPLEFSLGPGYPMGNIIFK